MRVVCNCSYKGTNYFGFERQIDTKTIEGEIERVISQLFNKNIYIYASGRTDAGVHAKGQVFHFDIDNNPFTKDDLKYRMNLMLEDDININSVEYLSDDTDFHSRYSAKGKIYEYRLSINNKDPFRYEYCWPVKSKDFDVELLELSLDKFVGKHNFSNFTSKEEDKDNYIRIINSISVSFDDINKEYVITFNGNGFMRYQIRFMVGVAIAIATKKESLDYIDKRLDNDNERAIVSYKGQPQGLTLMEVIY